MAIRIFVGVVLLGFWCNLFAHESRNEMTDVWIGAGKPDPGIYHCALNRETGKISDPVLAMKVAGPGFLALHPNGCSLYAVCSMEGKPSVAAYAVERDQGKVALVLRNSVEIGDGGGAHVAIDSTGKLLLTAQYGGGSVAVFAVEADGSIRERTQLIEHEGASGVVPRRQKRPHPHWVGFAPDNRFAFVPDLGMDRVVIYEVDVEAFGLTRHGVGVLPPGSGPRHMVFHSTGRWAYVLNEMQLSVTVFDYDAAAGTLTPKQTFPTVPKELLVKEKFASGSEIRMHPSGHFLYAANRGHDTITAFRVDLASGKLSVTEREPIRGAMPRNFNLDPSGRWLIAAGQHSHTLTSFEVNSDEGSLAYNRSCVYVPSPACVLFGAD